MKNITIFMVLSVIALGAMFYVFDNATNAPTGQYVQTYTRGGQPAGSLLCNRLQYDIHSKLTKTGTMTNGYVDNVRTVSKQVNQMQDNNAAIVDLVNVTTYPLSQYAQQNLSMIILRQINILEELTLITAEKKKLEIELKRVIEQIYDMHANYIYCVLQLYCPPACTLGEERTRQVMLRCDIEITQIIERIQKLEKAITTIRLIWEKYWKLINEVTKETEVIVAFVNRTNSNTFAFTNISGSWKTIEKQLLEIGKYEKRVAESQKEVLRYTDEIKALYTTAINCINSECPGCYGRVVEEPEIIVRPKEPRLEEPEPEIPKEPEKEEPQYIEPAPLKSEADIADEKGTTCAEECGKRGMTDSWADVKADCLTKYGKPLSLEQPPWKCICYPKTIPTDCI